MKRSMLKIYFSIACCFCCLGLFSCKQFLVVDPPVDQLSPALVFNSEDAANAAIAGIYSRMANGGSGGFASGDIGSVASFAGMCADELINYNVSYNEYYKNSIPVNSSNVGSNLWAGTYQYIYTANAIIEGVDRSNNLSAAARKQLLGEARFIRAFCFFYLTNLFGDIPMPLSTDYVKNSEAVRLSQDKVYDQIIDDLKLADELLPNAYYTQGRVRPTSWTAKAMLARVYLYTKNWQGAAEMADSVIENKSLFGLERNLENVFLSTSREAIWQLMPVRPGLNTNEGNLFIIGTALGSVSLSSELTDSFDKTDRRWASWVGSATISNKEYFYPYKYKVKTGSPVVEYSMILRLAEQYFIRGEALIEMGRISDGISDINFVRKRSRPEPTTDVPDPLPDYSDDIEKEEALMAVEKERRLELFTEWGHRWLDLKRTHRAGVVLSALKGTDWQDTDVLFPIPQIERSANHLITQNDGY